MKIITNAIKLFLLFFDESEHLKRKKNKENKKIEKGKENCKNGLHSWKKNPRYNKYSDSDWTLKYEFCRDEISKTSGRPMWWSTEFYHECEFCGHQEVTRRRFNQD